jgi:phosphoserine/homoserine phosphotransferase
MIQKANQGFFFQPPDAVMKDFPDIPVTRDYIELKAMIKTLL